MSYGIHWFRRDLRIAGNQALKLNYSKNKGRVVGLFCFDEVFLSRPDFSNVRFLFFLQTLKALRDELKSQGGDLLVLNQAPSLAFKTIFQSLEVNPTLVTFNRDYEPYARNRDEEVTKLLQEGGIKSLTARDHLTFEPHEILKEDKSYYQIYTPFSKRWLEAFHQNKDRVEVTGLQYYHNKPKQGLFSLTWKELLKHPSKNSQLKDSLDDFIKTVSSKVNIPIPSAGTQAAMNALKAFKPKISHYKLKRDYPFEFGTSALSIYLKNGSLTVPQIIEYLELSKIKKFDDSGESTYLKELIWREFYYSILWHKPEVEHESFNPKYKSIQWENDPKLFSAWCAGLTGYPIIDAGMRQLNETGWMHNRVRMIVASFLTKDLLIDWKWGEKYFMEKLLDGDLAPNNGGWQWAASTGCDAQPYFRIFNPSLQSERFDPEALYIKKYVPELRAISPKKIHNLEFEVKNYPKPIVDHAKQKSKAISLYKT